jgi:hypothetical protein
LRNFKKFAENLKKKNFFLEKLEKKTEIFPGKIEYFSRKSELYRSKNRVFLTFLVREGTNTLRGQCPIVVFARKFSKFSFYNDQINRQILAF